MKTEHSRALAVTVGSAKKTCEFTYKRLRPKRPGEKRCRKEFVRCGKPVAYKWTPRSFPQNFAWVCAECGVGAAGNFTDELTPFLPNTGHEPTSKS